MSTQCPACGSDSIETTTRKHSLPVVYGDPAVYDEVTDKCLVCGECGDFSESNDDEVEKALDLARKHSVVSILDVMSQAGIKMAYMERALDLPARTLARWKNGEISAASLALLRIIRTYPWVIEVADARFDQSVVRSKVVEEAGRILHEVLSPYDPRGHMVVTQDGDAVGIHTSLTLFKSANYSLQSQIVQTVNVGGVS
jgi:hypothetical protein